MDKNIIFLDNNFKDVINKLNNLRDKILIVLNKNEQVIGTITDGDVRRFLLKKKNKNIKNLMNKSPLILKTDDITNLTDQIRLKYKFAPLVNNNKKFLKLINLSYSPIQKDTTILILAGGKGIRLRPLTYNIPKPLIEIKNFTLIERIISSLSTQGFDDFNISVNYLKNKIIDKVKQNKLFKKKSINFLTEKKFLGTAGSLKLLKKAKKNILIINADILTNLNFKNLLSYHLQNKSEFTISIKETSKQIPYGVIHINQNEITSYKEKPIKIDYLNTGIYILNKKIINLIPNNKKFDMSDLIAKSIKKGYKIYPFYMFEKWVDVGSINTLVQLNKKYSKYFKNN